MFVNNAIRNDPRVKGEAKALARNGWNVTVVGTAEKGLPKEEIWENVRLLRYPRNWLIALWLRQALFGLFNLPAIYRKAATSQQAESSVDKKQGRAGIFGRMGQAVFSSILPSMWNWLLRTYHTRRLIPQVTRNTYDVYHAHDLDTLSIAAEASQRSNARLVYDSHELWINWQESLKLNPQVLIDDWRQIERDWSKKADLVITVSDGIAAILQKENQLAATPLVLYNCAELRETLESNFLHEIEPQVADGRPIVLYQGVIEPKRGLSQLTSVAKLLPDAHFVIIGPPSHERTFNTIQGIADELENLHLLPPVPYDQLWKVTQGADFGYVCTEPYCESYDLGIGNKLFEYLAAGLYVFASNVAGHRELLGKFTQEASPISLIPHNDPERVAGIIKAVLDDKESLIKTRENATRLVESKFNREIVMQKLVDAYRRFLL